MKILNRYNLETDFQTIKDKTINEWKRMVMTKIERANKERLQHDLKHEKGTSTIKTKTASISHHITEEGYNRIEDNFKGLYFFKF